MEDAKHATRSQLGNVVVCKTLSILDGVERDEFSVKKTSGLDTSCVPTFELALVCSPVLHISANKYGSH